MKRLKILGKMMKGCSLTLLAVLTLTSQLNAGVDLNVSAGYESGTRKYSNGLSASNSFKTIGTPISVNSAFFLNKIPVGLGLHLQSGTSKGTKDEVDHKLASTKISMAIKIWSPNMKMRFKPFFAMRYLLLNQETYSQEFSAGTSGFGTVKSTYVGKPTGYGADLGGHISINPKFYIYSALNYTAEKVNYSKIKLETDSGGSSSTDVVDKSKLTSALTAISIGCGITFGAGGR